MRGKHIKISAFITAFSILLPIFGGMPVFADTFGVTPSALSEDQTQDLTVVAKRITGDDTYFEISLEVNKDEEDYTSVGVVLEYDPDYIVPAASWDEGSGKADMSANTSWATRRALPTLGKETWTSHTALAYQTTDGEGKEHGYLYLGAEYPGSVTTEADASAATAEPTEEPEPDPDATPVPTDAPGTHPVVAARFMYKTVEAVEADPENGVEAVEGKDGAAVKAEIIEKWTKREDGATDPNWDEIKDWTDTAAVKNTILTLAPDSIAEKSPAQYPIAIYKKDFSELAYMRAFPTPEPTFDPASTDPTPTPKSAADYKPKVGVYVTEDKQLKTADTLRIVTLEGSSAKATGGIKLSDVFAILFFDWDDSFLGAITAAAGQELSPAVHAYVEETFIHPQLRTDKVNYIELTDEEKKQRKYNYRGEYPEEKPDATNPLAKTGAYGDDAAEPGSRYPLTNKLEYSFAGKNLVDEENPYVFAYGWTQVLASTPDYSDTTKYPGLMPQVLPQNMSDVNTAGNSLLKQTFERCPELDADGQLVNPDDTIPTWISYDFDNIKSSDVELSGGNLYVKAVYTAGEYLSKSNTGATSNRYITKGINEDGSPGVDTTGTSTATKSTYKLSLIFERVNTFGNGVNRIVNPVVAMPIVQNGASADTTIKITVENKDVIPVDLTPTNAVSTVGYQLRDGDPISGEERTTLNELGQFTLSGKDGIIFKFNIEKLLNTAKEHADEARALNKTPDTDNTLYKQEWTDASTWSGLHIYRASTATKLTAISAKTYYYLAQCAVVDIMLEAYKLGIDPMTLDWYQLQYAVLKKGTKQKNAVDYVTSEKAKEYIEKNNSLIIEDYNNI